MILTHSPRGKNHTDQPHQVRAEEISFKSGNFHCSKDTERLRFICWPKRSLNLRLHLKPHQHRIVKFDDTESIIRLHLRGMHIALG